MDVAILLLFAEVCEVVRNVFVRFQLAEGRHHAARALFHVLQIAADERAIERTVHCCKEVVLTIWDEAAALARPNSAEILANIRPKGKATHHDTHAIPNNAWNKIRKWWKSACDGDRASPERREMFVDAGDKKMHSKTMMPATPL